MMKKLMKLRHVAMSCTLLALIACNSDKERIQTYIDNFHPNAEIEIEGDVTVDSAFCPLTALDSASLVLMGHRMNLLHLLEVSPDSAFALARQLSQKYSDKNAFANIAYPKGPHNRLSYQAKCMVDGRERYVIFFKNPGDDFIETSSLEVDEAIDSLMSSFSMLQNGLQIILNDRKPAAEGKKKAEEPQPQPAADTNVVPDSISE